MTETKPKRYQCRHIFTDGHRCGSICLRGEEFCYYHHTTRKPAQNPRARRGRRRTFDLPITDPNDRTGLQSTIIEVLRRIASNDIDPRRAGLLLYGLQIASINLPKPQTAQRGRKIEEPETVEEITTHPELGILAPKADIDEIPINPKSAMGLLRETFRRNAEESKRSADATSEEAVSSTEHTLATLQAAEDIPQPAEATPAHPRQPKPPVSLGNDRRKIAVCVSFVSSVSAFSWRSVFPWHLPTPPSRRMRRPNVAASTKRPPLPLTLRSPW
jgi:hypothetical protein